MTRPSVLPEKQKGCFFFTISLKEVNHVQEKGVPIFSFRYLPGRRLLPVPVWIIFLPRDETMASRFSGDRHRRTGYCRTIRMPDCFGNDCCPAIWAVSSSAFGWAKKEPILVEGGPTAAGSFGHLFSCWESFAVFWPIGFFKKSKKQGLIYKSSLFFAFLKRIFPPLCAVLKNSGRINPPWELTRSASLVGSHLPVHFPPSQLK